MFFDNFMKKITNLLFAIFLLLGASCLSAQTIITSNSFQTDFEDSNEHKNWRLNTGRRGAVCVNKWYFGKAGANGGEYGLFISDDNGVNNTYTNKPVSVVSYRTITLDTGYYELSFDWQAGGLSGVDGMYVCWIPEDKVDTSSLVSVNGAYIQEDFINSQYGLFFSSDSLGLGQRTWNTVVDTIYSDGTKHHLVFVWHNSTIGSCPPGAAIDNLFIIELGKCSKPTDLSVAQKGDDIVFQWKGDAEGYDVRFMLGEYKEEFIVEDVKEKYYIINDSYAGIATFYVRSRCGEARSAWQSVSKFIYSASGECINFLNLDKKKCSIGTLTVNSLGGPVYNPCVVDFGYLAKESRHTVHWNHQEYDPRTVDGKLQDGLKTVPEGEFATVRLGNWDVYGETECIEYDYIVDSTEAAVLLLKYAVVLQDPSHEAANQPRFTLEVLHDDKPLDKYGCGEAYFTAGANTTGAGWHCVRDASSTSDNPSVVYWREWTTVGLNLKEYHGKSLKIRLKTFDCAQLGHYGYAYFTLSCSDGRIRGLTCGDDAETIFEGPEGFRYRWYLPSNPSKTISTDQRLKLSANDTLTYYLDVIQPTNANCHYTLAASGVGRWPQAYAEYEILRKNCQNTVKFINKSYIKRINQITTDTTNTVEKCDAFVWDFGDGTTSTDENPQHTYPVGGGTYTITLKSSIAGGKCYDDTTFTLTFTELSEVYDTTNVSVCLGEPYWHNGIPLYDEGFYTDTIEGEYGCDVINTLHLQVLPKSSVELSDTICSDEEYYFDGKRITETGTYVYEGKTVMGCDSIVTLDILVNESLHIDFDSVVYACEDDVNLVVPYNVTSGSFLSCDLEVASFDKPYMNLTDVVPESDALVVAMPEEVKPGKYNLSIEFGENSCGQSSVVLPMHVYYSKSILAQRWSDVLAVTNENYNGGYEFIAFQWYKNGMPIEGATSSILYLPEGLDLSAEYAVLLTRKSDNVAIMTCVAELNDLSANDVGIVIFRNNDVLDVDVPQAAKMKIWTPTGIFVKEVDLQKGKNNIQLSDLKGLFLLDFWLEDHQRYINIIILE